ncbi:aquaporin Z [Sphingomonas daechungensis]
MNMQKGLAELIGTFWLVFGGCGAAIYAAGFPDLGIGFAGVALAFGLTVLTMAFTIGRISGCHLNPAVTAGLWAAGRFPGKDIPLYVIAQVVGATLAAAALYYIASGAGEVTGLATNGFGDRSPGGFSLASCFAAEVLLTCFFLIVITGSTEDAATASFAPISIGLCLTLIHLISIPITNTSVNPARSTGPALIEGGEAIQQLWLFWLAPILGGLVGGYLHRHVLKARADS